MNDYETERKFWIFFICLWAGILLLLAFMLSPAFGQPCFVRGDSNNDGITDQSDATYTLLYLFSGGSPPICRDAADSDDNGFLELPDGEYILIWLYLGGPQPPSPWPLLGPDPTPDVLDCGRPTCIISLSFRRGDADGNGTINQADASFIAATFPNGTFPCQDAADANDDGNITNADIAFLNNFLTQGGPAPPSPFPGCGPDPTAGDNLGCTITPCQ